MPQEARDDFSRRRPDAWRMDEQIPSTSTALSDTRSVNDESVPKRKGSEKFELGPLGGKRQHLIRGMSLFSWRNDIWINSSSINQ